MAQNGPTVLYRILSRAHHGSLTTAVRTQTNVLPVFVILQSLDVATTLAFLHKGIAEGNPLLALSLPYTHAPWIALLAVKLIATLIGLYCYRTGRIAALRLANVAYFLIVGWNLATIAAWAMLH